MKLLKISHLNRDQIESNLSVHLESKGTMRMPSITGFFLHGLTKTQGIFGKTQGEIRQNSRKIYQNSSKILPELNQKY